MPRPIASDGACWSNPGHYLGIDPGLSGGLALLNNIGQVERLDKMPATERDIWLWFSTLPPGTRAVIEKVHSMPEQGIASSFKFGYGFGGLVMALTATNIPFVPTTPQKWIKALAIPSKKSSEGKTQWKNRLKAKAQQLYPQSRITLAVSDALLIAHYCRGYAKWTL